MTDETEREHRANVDAILARIERDLAEAGKLRREAHWEPAKALAGALGVMALGMFLAIGAARAIGWIGPA